MVSDLIGYVCGIGDDIKNPARQFHYTGRMLETFVCRSWVNKICQCKLVDMTQPLEWT